MKNTFNVFCITKQQIFPLTGSSTHLLSKPKFQGLFDAVFISARYAQYMEDDFLSNVLNKQENKKALIAVETAKFLVTLSGDVKKAFSEKLDEFSEKKSWRKLTEAPVFRRRRDERDLEDDVHFYTT